MHGMSVLEFEGALGYSRGSFDDPNRKYELGDARATMILGSRVPLVNVPFRLECEYDLLHHAAADRRARRRPCADYANARVRPAYARVL